MNDSASRAPEDATPAPAPEVSADLQPTPQNPGVLRVLIVEDALAIRLRLRSMLEETSPVEIIGETGSGAEAELILRRFRPDVVIVDLKLQQGDGFNVCVAARKLPNRCFVITLTAFSNTGFRRLAEHAGADYFFDKTTEFERVPEVLRELAARRTAPP